MFSLTQLQGVLKALTGWVTTIPSESNGRGSSSRIIALSVTATVVGLLIAYFHVRHELPSAEQLLALGGILGTGTACYVANRVASNNDSSGT